MSFGNCFKIAVKESKLYSREHEGCHVVLFSIIAVVSIAVIKRCVPLSNQHFLKILKSPVTYEPKGHPSLTLLSFVKVIYKQVAKINK